jgi:hypothetical protein
MKHTGFLLSLVACGAVVAASSAGAQAPGHAYAGVKTCGMCHKTEKQGSQLSIWEGSKHSKAYATLTTPAANDIAKAKGITTPAAEAPACLKCHAIAGDAKALVTDGVQCESCHGAGADYKGLTVMKVKATAIAAGLTAFADKAAVEAKCKTCHNSDSPTAKPFNFEERWEKIKHPVPPKTP